MKYNEKYNRWVTTGGVVYRYDSKQDKLVLCKLSNEGHGYLIIRITKNISVRVHRLVYETFVCRIPKGYEIDHINTVRDDNRLENLRCVTRKENLNNPLTRKHISEAAKGKKHYEEWRKKLSEANKGKIIPEETKQKIRNTLLNKPRSEFGRKYFEHFGYSLNVNKKQYKREFIWYKNHNNRCRWEKEE